MARLCTGAAESRCSTPNRRVSTMPAESTRTAMPMKRTRLAGATYQNGLSGASTGVARNVASVNFVFDPSAAIRSMSATASVRACTASVVDDSTRKSAFTELPGAGSWTIPATTRPRRMSSVRPVLLFSTRTLIPSVVCGRCNSRADGWYRPIGSLGLPSSSPVIKMMTTGTSVPMMSRRRSPMARRKLTQMTAITSRLHHLAHAGHGQASGHHGDEQQNHEGSDDAARRFTELVEAAEADQPPPVRRAERQHLEGVGQRAGRQQVPAHQRQEEADEQRD